MNVDSRIIPSSSNCLTETSQIGIGTGVVKLKEEEEFQHENYDRIRSMGEEGVWRK